MLVLAIAVSTLALGCPKATPYACQANDDCTLGGGGGICLASGSCGYANPECPSGFAYAAGSPGDLASQCVPEAGVPDSAGVGTDAGSTSEPSSGGSTSPDATGSTSSGASTTGTTGIPNPTSSESTVSATAATTATADTGEDPCLNRDESPDNPSGTEPSECRFEFSGQLEDGDTGDWFALEACSLFTNANLSGEPGSEAELCLLASCVDDPSCAGGEMTSIDRLKGCCGAGDVSMQPAGGCEPTSLFVGVRPSPAGSPACVDYTLSLSLK